MNRFKNRTFTSLILGLAFGVNGLFAQEVPPIVQPAQTVAKTSAPEESKLPLPIPGLIQAVAPATGQVSPVIRAVQWQDQNKQVDSNAPLDVRTAAPSKGPPVTQSLNSQIQLASGTQDAPARSMPRIISPGELQSTNNVASTGPVNISNLPPIVKTPRVANLPQIQSSPQNLTRPMPQNFPGTGNQAPSAFGQFGTNGSPMQSPLGVSGRFETRNRVQPDFSRGVGQGQMMNSSFGRQNPTPANLQDSVLQKMPDDTPGNPSYFDQQQMELGKDLPKFSGVTAFGEGASGCACGTCGENGGCDSPRCQYDVNSVCEAFNCCGFVASARWYVRVEGLYGFVNSDGVVGSTVFSAGEYNGVFGARLTFGGKDGVRGRELIVSLFDTWSTSAARAGGFFGLNASVSPGIFPPLLTAPFYNADFQSQTQEANFYTAQLNRTWWGWDVVKTHIGLRYFYFKEDYFLLSQNIFGTGILDVSAENNYVGPEIGVDLFYDVGRRTAFTTYGTASGGVDFGQGRIRAASNGLQFVNNTTNNSAFAYNFGFGARAHWKVGPRARFTIGYEGFFAYKVDTVRSIYPTVLGATPAGAGNDDNIFVNAFSVGFEIYR